MPPRAIETRYKGYRFRSRLEARWAVFFDHIGLQWEYEPEGFELGGGVRYLPDFRIDAPGFTVWYEIKPRYKTTDAKFEAFKDALGDSDTEFAFLLSGSPIDLLNSGWAVCPRCGTICKHEVYDFGHDIGFNCFPCDCNTPGGGGHATERGLLSDVTPHKGSVLLSHLDFAMVKRNVTKAANNATGARFEHGENGGAK